MVAIGLGFLLPVGLVGPRLIWGLLGAETCEGTVAAIQPGGESDSDTPECYLVEVHTADAEVHNFSSSDRLLFNVKEYFFFGIAVDPLMMS